MNIMNQLFYRTVISFVICFVSINVFGQDKEEGNYQGMHWQITGNYGERCLIVDGETILNYKKRIRTREIGGKLYFEAVVKSSGNYLSQLYSIKGDRVIPYDYKWLEFPKNKEEWDWVKVYRVDKTNWLYNSDLKLLHSNASSISPKVITLEGINEIFLDVTLEDGENLVHALYSADWKLVVPIYKYFGLSSSGDYYNFNSPNGFEGKLDKSFHWIGPSATLAQQFEKIEQIQNENNYRSSAFEYYKCKKGGYWGLYDSNLKEIVAPDYEDFRFFDGTNFIKFKLNGFWGVMTLQGRVTKTIIPTTRGYTSIDRYVKSLKRFTYTMNGYKGECNHLGQQLSKIKVDTPSQTSVASSSSSTSSSSSSSSSTASSNSSSSSNSGNKTTTVVVEHHRDPIPVQQWQACLACGGMGTMGCDNCGGSGTKYIGDRLHRCSLCNGQGIIPCRSCYGNKGQYITVYR